MLKYCNEFQKCMKKMEIAGIFMNILQYLTVKK